MTDMLKLFIPISKIDSQSRTVYGTISEEVADKSGEILDYASAKPAFEKWSGEIEKNTDGKSKGNLRAMHSNVAAGKFTAIAFDDDAKRIEGCAKVVDDNEWNKVVEGVYTGFSIGGGYAKRWTDPQNPALKRYTPELSEVSLVDNPCVPTATFEFIKEDGSTELRKFHTEEAKEEEAPPPHTRDGVRQRWIAEDGSEHLLKADAIKRNEQIKAEAVTAPALEALKKLDEAITKAEAGEKPEEEKPAESQPEQPQEEQPEEQPKEAAAKADAPKDLKKGLEQVARLACLIQELDWLQSGLEWEAASEGDNSPLPAAVKSSIAALCESLKALVAEETSELFDGDMPEVEIMAMAAGLPADHAAAMRKSVDPKHKTLSACLEKVGAKISAATKGHIDAMHKSASDHMAKMDECYKSLGMGKAAPEEPQTSEREIALQKTLDSMTPQLEALIKRIDHLERQPMPPKGALRVIDKVADGHNASGGDDVQKLQDVLKGKSPEETTRLLMKAALSKPMAHLPN